MIDVKSLGVFAYRALVVLGLGLLFAQNNSLQYKANRLDNQVQGIESIRTSVDTIQRRLDTLEIIHPWKDFAKKPRKSGSNICKEGTFFGFIIYTPVDTTLHSDFKAALSEYSGPSVKVNSMKRHGSRSLHCKGKAIDVQLNSDVVEYLLGDDGRKWLDQHGLTFMIEGRPGSQKVAQYNKYAKYASYVFFNPKATGDHIHIEKKA